MPLHRASAEPPVQPTQLPDTVRLYSPAELIGVHESVFVTLFDRPWSEENWEYALSTAVNGEGAYNGVNHLGQPFSLNVVLHAEIDLQQAQLDLPTRQWIVANSVRLGVAIATLSTPLARIAVHGFVVSSNQDGRSTFSKFWLINTIDPTNAIFESSVILEPPLLSIANKPRNDHLEGLGPVFENNQVGGSPEECGEKYQAKLARAERQEADKISDAGRDRDRRIQSAHDAFANAQVQASSEFAIQASAAAAVLLVHMLVCAFFTPIGGVFCLLNAAVTYAAAIALFGLILNDKIAKAKRTRDSEISNAMNEHQENVDRACRDYEVERRFAETELGLCLGRFGGGGGEDGAFVPAE